MKNRNTKQNLADEVKREVLMELNLTPNHHRHLVDSIKRDVLQGLDHYGPDYSHSILAGNIKNQVLAEISRDMGLSSENYHHPYDSHRAMVDTVKREVMTQIETEQENQREMAGNEEGTTGQHYVNVDPVLVQEVKRSVMAEINTPHYR